MKKLIMLALIVAMAAIVCVNFAAKAEEPNASDPNAAKDTNEPKAMCIFLADEPNAAEPNAPADVNEPKATMKIFLADEPNAAEPNAVEPNAPAQE